MYNVKGPSKIVAKTTRRGLSQNLDNFRDSNKNKVMEPEQNESNVSKPVFHKKYSPNHHQQEVISPQHEEIIKFIHESWNSVCSEADEVNSDKNENNVTSVVYYEEEPCQSMQDFKPFDLESWWGKRLYAYITSSVNGKN